VTGRAAQITIQSSGALNLSGAPGAIAASGSGANTITVAAAGNNPLTFASSYTFNAGTSGTINLRSPASGGSIVFQSGTTQTIAGSSALTISTPSLPLPSGTAIN